MRHAPPDLGPLPSEADAKLRLLASGRKPNKIARRHRRDVRTTGMPARRQVRHFRPMRAGNRLFEAAAKLRPAKAPGILRISGQSRRIFAVTPIPWFMAEGGSDQRMFVDVPGWP